MKKIIALIKAAMTDNMSIFKIKNKKQTKATKKLLPIMLTICLFISFCSYANMLMEPLNDLNLEYVVLTIFILFTTIMTIIQGIYKAGNLIFNCKDDNLMFSLPVKKQTILFVRIFKFYVFEVLYNSIFLAPAMVVYRGFVDVNYTFYIVSLFALLILPIVPIVISCFIGGIISYTSSKFKMKNFAQILITIPFILGVFYISFNLQGILENIAKNATTINDIITKLYYPAGLYIKLITNYHLKDLFVFIVLHIAVFALMILVLGKVYFKINSNIKTVKTIKTIKTKSKYKIKAKSPMKALIRKELNKFITSPVFVINSGMGLFLYVVACIIIPIKFESVVDVLATEGVNTSLEQLHRFIAVIHFGLICCASSMSSITCSMISLDGKTFNILKSLPVKPYKIIMSKVYTAVIIMIPFILLGDIIIFINFKFTVLQMIMLVIASIILPFVSEMIGIIVNLKYPKMDAETDTEVVKQSMSSFIAVFSGMALTGITAVLLYKAVIKNIKTDILILVGILIYSLIYILLKAYLKKKGVKDFNSINV